MKKSPTEIQNYKELGRATKLGRRSAIFSIIIAVEGKLAIRPTFS